MTHGSVGAVRTQHGAASLLVLVVPLRAFAEPRVVDAVRRDGPLDIDGRLIEPAWQAAKPAGDFFQRLPFEGETPRLATEFRVLYDDEALYVGVRAFDPAPDELHSLLTRYDEFPPSDWIVVGLDTYHDRRTAFQFGVNAGGTRFDEVLYDDIKSDPSWNAVWEGRHSIDTSGWSVEFRIPLGQLRYPDVDEQVWGLQVTRVVQRHQEHTVWAPWPFQANQRVSMFGELRSIRGLAQRRRLELAPYALGGLAHQPGRSLDAVGGAGLDARYGLGANMTISATLNPDFGQVEADPSDLNLSALETFFPEKRPFFLEGGDLFRRRLYPYVFDEGSPEEVFYSRRIGAPPHGGAARQGLPEATTIYGAAKLTGKTARGLSLGVLSAITAEERLDDATAEPLTHYAVARVRQDFDRGRTTVGAIATAVQRKVDGTAQEVVLHDQAIVGGVDVARRFGDDESWSVEAVALGSWVHGSAEAVAATQRASPRYLQRPGADYLSFDPERTDLSGYSAAWKVGRWGGGHLRGGAGADLRSPGFETNDLGFLQKADHLEPWLWAQWYEARPGEHLQNYRFNTTLWTTATTEPRVLAHWWNGNAHAALRNGWSTGAGLSRMFGKWDPRALRGGPSLRIESRWLPWAYLASDTRRRLSARVSSNSWWQPTNESWSVGWDGWVSLRLLDRMELTLGTSGERRLDDTQYVGSFAGSDGTHDVVARINQTTVRMTLRVRLGISPRLSVDLYAQPFVSRGAFRQYRDVTDPSATEYDDRFTATTPGAFDGFGAADFRFRELRSNVVIRWEYRPGSAAILAWSHGRTTEAINGDVGGDIDALAGAGDDVVMLKLSYWMGR